MRYFSYDEPIFSDDDHFTVIGNRTVTLSEEDIRREYYPYWSDAMIRKYGKEAFERDWSFEECLEDFVAGQWAREVPEGE